jgi:hypothetical protein
MPVRTRGRGRFVWLEGNRAINTALRMIAVTQLRGVGSGKAHVDGMVAQA